MKINAKAIILMIGYYIVTRAISDLVFNMPQIDYLVVLSLGILGGCLGNSFMFKSE